MTALDDLPLVVLDTCCYFHFFTCQDSEAADRVVALVEGHQKEHLIVVPSVVELETFGQVQKGINGHDGAVPERRQAKLAEARAWFADQQFMTAELDPRVVGIAMRVMHEYGLKGMDASIVATAIAHDAEALYTYDRLMLKVADKISGLVVDKPPPTDKLFPLPKPD